MKQWCISLSLWLVIHKVLGILTLVRKMDEKYVFTFQTYLYMKSLINYDYSIKKLKHIDKY
jgi:hypothetical protein